MKIFKNIANELQKNLYLPFFLLAVIGLNVLFFMSEGAKGADGKGYSIFQLVIMSSRLPLRTRIEFCWLELWKEGLSRWTILVAPVLSAAGFIYSNSEEMKTGADIFLQIRQQRFGFAVGKVLSGALSTAITFTLAYSLFGLVLSFFFVWPDSYDESLSYLLERMYGDDVGLYILKRTVGVFLTGIYMSLFPIFLAVCTADRYLLVSLPIIWTYMRERFIQKLWYLPLGKDNPELVEAIDPENLPNIFFHRFTGISIQILIVAFVFCFIFFYIIRFKRRVEST